MEIPELKKFNRKKNDGITFRHEITRTEALIVNPVPKLK